nr:hypothetical protein [Saprospiraceae bacterium]
MYIIQLFLIFALSATLQAAEVSYEINDPKAKQLLEEVKKNVLSEPSWVFDFELVVNFPDMDPEVINGQLKQDGQKIKADLGAQVITSDGKTVWTYLKDFNEVQISNFDEDMQELFLSPSQIVRIYESGEYIYQYSGNQEFRGRQLQLIEFRPADPKASEYVKINLWLDMKSKVPVGVMINARNGVRYNLFIEQHQKGVKHHAGVFTFNPAEYPGVEIDDLRF